MKRLFLFLFIFIYGFYKSQTINNKTTVVKHETITTTGDMKKFYMEMKKEDSIKKSIKSIQNNFDGSKYVDSVFILMNEYRVKNGLEPLKFCKNLSKVSDLQANYCSDNFTITHRQPDESMMTCFERGLKYNERLVTGEVIAENSVENAMIKKISFSNAPIELFKKSKSHSEIILYPIFVRCGISIKHTTDKSKYYTVIVFSED
jgi:uncharacterized protein YkwD